jgi:peroxiredoxin
MKTPRTSDWIALGLALGIGAPLVYAIGGAYVEGEVSRREAPLRGLLGPRAYEALREGDETPQHYMQRPPVPAWVGAFGDNRRLTDRSRDRRMPNFALQTRGGDRWSMRAQRGTVVVLNFWSITCPPCLEEMPSLVELAELLEGRDDISLVAVSTDRNWQAVDSAVPPESKLTVLLDPGGEIARNRLGTRLYPETWVVDRDGVIRLRVDGARDWSSALVMNVLEGYL